MSIQLFTLRQQLSVILILLTSNHLHVFIEADNRKFVVCSIILNESSVPYDYRRTAPAVEMALENVQLKYGGDFQLDYRFIDGGNVCKGNRIGAIAAKLHANLNISAFIGPGCSFAVEILGYMAASWNLPLITPVGTKSSLSNKKDYNTVTRLSYDMSKFAKFYRTLFTLFGWEHVAVIYDMDNIFSKIVGLSLHPDFERNRIYSKEYPYNSGSNPDYEAIFTKASSRARIFVMASNGDTMRKLMLLAHDKKMTNGEYCFIFIRLFDGDDVGDPSWFRNDSYDFAARQAYESVLTVTLMKPESDEFHNFTQEVRRRALADYDYDYGAAEVNNFIVGFYDAFLIYAEVLNKTLAEGGDPYDGLAITHRMWNSTFEGMSGRVAIDENGDRETDFSLLDMDPVSGDFRVVGNYFGSQRLFKFLESSPIHWPNHAGPPPDIPGCGFLGDAPKCNPYNFPLYGIITLAFGGVIIVIVLVGLFVYRRMKLESDLESNWWKVKWEEVHLHNKSVVRSLLSTSRAEAQSSVSAMDAQQLFALVGLYKGNCVAIKKLHLKSISVTRELKLEMKQMRDISHPNLVKFVGISTEPPTVAILTEYCQKGSLQDILGNSSIQLDWEFKLSLLNDVCLGMTYLHQCSMGVHGYLSSSNCVIDNRFVLKLTDYGLLSIRAAPNSTSQAREGRKLWIAPEHLRRPDHRVSREGDVYSFGIIVYEIVSRQEPFENELDNFELCEIITKIANGSSPPFRPSIEGLDCTKEALQLICSCWDEEPQRRPTFANVQRSLKAMNSGGEGNLLDTLLRRMENYANNLEQLVEERTNAFLEEKKKSEQLLYQVLPRSVAEQLKNGKSVQPEAYDCVTIYFSDICGFTNISAESTPIQVIDLLNDLYTCFDSTIDTFDVYKVETIGDAYMVVSGLPLRNGDEHAREIALMSLAILERVKHFKIRHKPEEPLRARIGVHSGSVCSGVVGLKMPRYCLFGDTVNTASRMESHGEALKIHTSDSTKTLLDEIGGFNLEPRGEITVKGKGQMKTYWLLGAADSTGRIRPS